MIGCSPAPITLPTPLWVYNNIHVCILDTYYKVSAHFLWTCPVTLCQWARVLYNVVSGSTVDANLDKRSLAAQTTSVDTAVMVHPPTKWQPGTCASGTLCYSWYNKVSSVCAGMKIKLANNPDHMHTRTHARTHARMHIHTPSSYMTLIRVREMHGPAPPPPPIHVM